MEMTEYLSCVDMQSPPSTISLVESELRGMLSDATREGITIGAGMDVSNLITTERARSMYGNSIKELEKARETGYKAGRKMKKEELDYHNTLLSNAMEHIAKQDEVIRKSLIRIDVDKKHAFNKGVIQGKELAIKELSLYPTEIIREVVVYKDREPESLPVEAKPVLANEMYLKRLEDYTGVLPKGVYKVWVSLVLFITLYKDYVNGQFDSETKDDYNYDRDKANMFKEW